MAQTELHLCPYFSLKALNQNGYEQVEEDVVAEGHEGYEIEGSQWRGGGHPIIEHGVPVLLGEDLQMGRDARETSGGRQTVCGGTKTPVPNTSMGHKGRIIRADSSFNISL